MSNLFRSRKNYYLLSMVMVIIFVSFASFKAYKMASLYEASSISMQSKVEETTIKFRSGNINMDPENLVIILKASADRTLEDGVVSWFNKYLFVFIFLFGSTMLFTLFREFTRLK